MKAAAIAIIGFGSLIGLAIWAGHAEEKACADKGGHMLSRTSTGVGVGSNGSVSVVPVTTSFCISSDGRILE